MNKQEIKQNAEFLWNVLNSKEKKSQEEALASFVAYLGKRGELRYWRKVTAAFLREYYQKNGIIEAKIVASEKLPGEEISKISHWLASYLKSDRLDVQQAVKKDLGQGIRIELNGDTLIDLSVRGQVERLRSTMGSE
jgi:ATP synthase F1 delta subunit